MRQVSPFDVANLKAELEELNRSMEAPGFWDNIEEAQKVNKRAKNLENRIQRFENLYRAVDENLQLWEMADDEGDEDTKAEVGAEVGELARRVEELRLSTMLKGEYDANNAYLSLHAGAGGTEAQDWASMLYRMYTRYCEKHGYTVKLLDLLEGEEAGIKSVSFMVEGDNAYGYLKAEKGVHRLVRISPFDSSGRRHTSFASLDVMPEIENDDEVEIDPDDVRVDTYRSSGAGGQHVNKTSSAIRLTHIPTGIVVQCQNERSQIQNRETAWRMLRSKLVELKEREMAEKHAELKGEMKKIEWGSQIRSYVFHPYTMVKDHRTGAESGNITAVMDGDLDLFITEYLMKS
ncbi:MAG: peptide chain release factor 2 [Bacillota bacterium]|nr:MAG: peptide chain release factor 2 [Bacillota bacterium]